MPSVNMTLEQFEDYRVTMQTDATKAMDLLFAQPAAVASHPEYNTLITPGGLNTLSPGIRAMLGDEADHMEQWPDAQMERMRQKLVQSIQENRPVHFFSRLYYGASEELDILDPDGKGEITITFLSPAGRVRVSVMVGS
ncbi:hypothetical protein HZA56_00740 [Candidatus Poribacteria bacterium]|nr:hypothetical protein [Candidatus Poribacteria bacterium]